MGLSEFITSFKGEGYKKYGDLQEEIQRDNWEKFLVSSQIRDLKAVFKHLAKEDGRVAMGFRPSCPDPLEKGGCMGFGPKEKAGALADYFEDKLTARMEGRKNTTSQSCRRD